VRNPEGRGGCEAADKLIALLNRCSPKVRTQ